MDTRLLKRSADLTNLLRRSYDLAILALGADYAEAAGGIPAVASPTLALCGATSKIARHPARGITPVPIAMEDLKRFGAGKVAV